MALIKNKKTIIITGIVVIVFLGFIFHGLLNTNKEEKTIESDRFINLVLKNQLAESNSFSSLSNNQSKVADIKLAYSIIRQNIYDKSRIIERHNIDKALSVIDTANTDINNKRYNNAYQKIIEATNLSNDAVVDYIQTNNETIKLVNYVINNELKNSKIEITDHLIVGDWVAALVLPERPYDIMLAVLKKQGNEWKLVYKIGTGLQPNDLIAKGATEEFANKAMQLFDSNFENTLSQLST